MVNRLKRASYMERRKIESDLLNSGFPSMQSEALSYLFAEMATKQDLRELRTEMHGEFRAIRGEMHQMKAELREAIAESGRQTVEAFAAFQNKLFTYLLALIGTLTAIITLLLLLIR